MLMKLILKHGDKAIYSICGFIVIALAAILIIIFANTCDKTPATYNQVNTELINLNYEPINTTDTYKAQSSNLNGSIACDSETVHFYFFEFNNDDSAYSLFHNNHDLIYENISAGFREWDEHYDNYAMYSMSSNGTYYISIWVGNTAVYAYCDEEYTSELGKILTAIGYQDS